MGKLLTFFYSVRGEVLQICNGLNANPGLAIHLNGDSDPVPDPGFCHPTDSNIYRFLPPFFKFNFLMFFHLSSYLGSNFLIIFTSCKTYQCRKKMH